MIGTLLATALAGIPNSCPSPPPGRTLLQEMAIEQSWRTIKALVYSVDESKSDGNLEVVIQSADCGTLFLQRLGGSKVALAKANLGTTPLLIVTTLAQGGSGCGLNHALIDLSDRPSGIAPTALRHDNMSAMFVGDLGQRRGAGLVMMQALWEGGPHYSPHRYRIVRYRWTDEHFIGPTTTITEKKFSPIPEEVAAQLGLPFSMSMHIDCG